MHVPFTSSGAVFTWGGQLYPGARWDTPGPRRSSPTSGGRAEQLSIRVGPATPDGCRRAVIAASSSEAPPVCDVSGPSPIRMRPPPSGKTRPTSRGAGRSGPSPSRAPRAALRDRHGLAAGCGATASGSDGRRPSRSAGRGRRRDPDGPSAPPSDAAPSSVGDGSPRRPTDQSACVTPSSNRCTPGVDLDTAMSRWVATHWTHRDRPDLPHPVPNGRCAAKPLGRGNRSPERLLGDQLQLPPDPSRRRHRRHRWSRSAARTSTPISPAAATTSRARDDLPAPGSPQSSTTRLTAATTRSFATSPGPPPAPAPHPRRPRACRSSPSARPRSSGVERTRLPPHVVCAARRSPGRP